MVWVNFPHHCLIIAHLRFRPLSFIFTLTFYPLFYTRDKGRWWSLFTLSCNLRHLPDGPSHLFCSCCLSHIRRMRYRLYHLLCIPCLNMFAICPPRCKDDLISKVFRGLCKNQCVERFWLFIFFHKLHYQIFQGWKAYDFLQLHIQIFSWISY